MDEEKKDLSLTEDQAQQMPEETKAAEEVQSAEEAAAEVQQEETVEAETVTEEAETAEEPAAEPVEPAPVQTAAPAKSGSNIVGIIVGLLVFIGVLALCWKMVGPVGEVHADKGIAYAKDNNLYIYDLENDTYVAAEGISAGGQYNQYYSAWGTTFNEDGSGLYYSTNVRTDGTFDLYYKGVNADSEGVLVGEAVADYMPTKDGAAAIFVKTTADGAADLYQFVNGTSTLVESNILPESGSYAISNDGSFVMYRKSGDNGTALYAKGTAEGEEAVCIHENAATAMMTSDTGEIYFAGAEGEGYAAFVYAYGTEPVKIMDEVTYLEVMPNGKDVLLMGPTEGLVTYDSIIEDDLEESDALLTEADGDAYQAKLQRDAIRTAMEGGEGFEPVLQKVYMYSNGKLTEVAAGTISAVSVENDRPYAVCYAAGDMEKMPISQLGSLEDAERGYYMTLMYTEPKILVVNATGGSWQLEGKNISPANVFLSDDGTMVGYYETDTLTGATMLNIAKLGAEPSFTMENVEAADFLGTTHDVAYFKDYENGLGTMGVWNGGDPVEVESVGGVHFAVDQNAVYYINNIDQQNGNGDLHVMANGEDTLIDSGVYSMQYKYNGKLAYLKNYDYTANRGDLYYYDGKESKEIDTGITAIFMY
ncbi:MAG: hypothetical protein V8Q36_08815 [Anaerotignum sp.]|uniref:hypothetical protein n=1 Tax=Anaerotignum sp. TaxID=2039241 RepID=UPI0027B8E6AF|nr:hypothetical protein [Anaerotignum sp.]